MSFGFVALPSCGRAWIVRGPMGILLSRHDTEAEARAEVARLDRVARADVAVTTLIEILRSGPEWASHGYATEQEWSEWPRDAAARYACRRILEALDMYDAGGCPLCLS